MLHIPASIKERAAIVYRKLLDNGLVRGRSIAATAAASLYAACRMCETPRTLKDVSAASRIRKKDLDLRMPTQQRAIKVINDAKKQGVVAGKDPMGLVAAALYVACVLEGERKTQKEIAEAANVTEVTVRNRYKGLKEALNLNI
jgi:transcription initiation factor TFIIB